MIKSLIDLNQAKEEASSTEPKRFIFNGNTYVHIPETETFYLDGTPLNLDGKPAESLTALKIMKANFTPTRAYYERIEPLNPQFYLFGDSARFKIIRAVQLHNCEPPVTAETNQWIPFFQFLSTGVEDHWQVQQQYSSCKWACGKDEELAASQLLHYGWVPKYNVQMGDPCIYKMTKQDWGINICTNSPHNFNDRLAAACAAASAMKARLKHLRIQPTYLVLFKAACQIFFSFNGWYVSIPGAYRQAILNKITSYVTHLLNAIGNASPSLPYIEEPENIFSQDEPIKLKWEDFSFLSTSDAQHKQRLDNNYIQSVNAFLKIWPSPDAEVSSTYLRKELQVNGKRVAAAVEKKILLVRYEGRRTFYRLNPNLERSND